MTAKTETTETITHDGRIVGEITRVGVWYVARDARGRIVRANGRMNAHDDRAAAIRALHARG